MTSEQLAAEIKRMAITIEIRAPRDARLLLSAARRLEIMAHTLRVFAQRENWTHQPIGPPFWKPEWGQFADAMGNDPVGLARIALDTQENDEAK